MICLTFRYTPICEHIEHNTARIDHNQDLFIYLSEIYIYIYNRDRFARVQITYRTEFFSGLIFTTAQVVFYCQDHFHINNEESNSDETKDCITEETQGKPTMGEEQLNQPESETGSGLLR